MRGHIMINAVTVGPEVEFYGVDTPFGEMFEVSVSCETTEKEPWARKSRRTFLTQDIVLGIKGGFGSVNWLEYNGNEVIDTINEIPADSDIDYYVKTPIVVRLDDIIGEIN